jgi:hypothetical protein
MTFRFGSWLAVAAIGFMVLPGTSSAKLSPGVSLEDALSESERDALGTLALAGENMRDAILEVSLHPQSVERIASISRDTSDQFRERMKAIPRSKQKDMWELVRYPELIDELVQGGRPARGAVVGIVSPYPESIRKVATRIVDRDFNLLNDIAHLHSDAERETAKLIASLPLSAQANFQALIERPDLMSALADHPGLLDELGTQYREAPLETRDAFNRYHEEETLRNEQEIAQWREAIEDDPEARAELIQSAEAFAEEEGYDSPREVERIVERTEVHHYSHPYPYWFGPPHWRASYHWYPHRSHWGFNFDTGGSFIVFGLPSAYYSSWHYRHPQRRHHYGHIDRHFNRHAPHKRHYRGARIREHARSHKPKRHNNHYRGQKRRGHQKDVHVSNIRNQRRDPRSVRNDDRKGGGTRSRIRTRKGDGDVRTRKHTSKFRDATRRAKQRASDRRASDKGAIRSRVGERRADASRTSDRKKSRAQRPKARSKSKSKSKTEKIAKRSKSLRDKTRGDMRRNAPPKVSKRSSRPSARKRIAKRSGQSRLKAPARKKSSKSTAKRLRKSSSNKLSAKRSRSGKSNSRKSGSRKSKKNSNGGRNFGRR